MDNTIQSSSYNFQLSRPFSLISKTKKIIEENNLIFKSIKFYNKKYRRIIMKLHDKSLERDMSLRIKEETKRKSVLKKGRSLLKYILIKLKMYYLIKYIYLIFFKADYYFEKVVVLDKSLTDITKKNIRNFTRIIEFNKNYKFKIKNFNEKKIIF